MSKPTKSSSNLSPLKQALLLIDDLEDRLARAERSRSEPIAIIGIGCRFPGGVTSPEQLWTLLSEGVDAITEVPKDRWDADAYYSPDPDVPGRIATRWGGFVDRIDEFDAGRFGISPREAHSMDPQQRVLLEVVWEALERAGYRAETLARARTGVFVGISSDEYAQGVIRSGEVGRLDAYFASGVARSVAAGRISYVLGLNGPCFALDTACSSSLVAAHVACQSLRSQECEVAIAGGVNLVLSPESTMALSRAHMMAPDGRCKAFDASANGFVRGEGCGIVVLKRLSDAIAHSDNVLAVIRGTAINQDGRSAGLTVPNGPSQESVIRAALSSGGVLAGEVSYVEAHGTGTSLGDPIEAHALAAVYGAGREASNPLVIGSVKSNLGHLESAAGVAGLIKVVLALEHQRIPRSLHFNVLNPHIDLRGSAVEVAKEARVWPRVEQPRRAGISSFGFSGTNAHVILEEAPAPPLPPREAAREAHVLCLSARTERGARALAESYAALLRQPRAPRIEDVCFTASTGRLHDEHRVAIVGPPRAIQSGLDEVAMGRGSTPVLRGRVERDAPRVAFLFSGQGSQVAGMGRRLYQRYPVFRAAVERCAASLEGVLPVPLLEVLFGGRGELISETSFTQPAIFALQHGLVELWKSFGVDGSAVLGHSVGELAGAVAAGLMGVDDAVRLVAARGRLVQDLGPGGAMVAVSAEPSRATRVAEAFGVDVAAVNGPGRLVLSGAREQVRRAAAELGDSSPNWLLVSHAFHSRLLDPIRGDFEGEVERVRFDEPRAEVVSGALGRVATRAELSSPEYWWRQLREPVLFRAGLESLRTKGYSVFVEMGAGSTLSSLGRACESNGRWPGSEAAWIPSLRRGLDEEHSMSLALSALHVRGVEIDWVEVERPFSRRRVALPTYPFERQRYWLPEVSRGRIPGSLESGAESRVERSGPGDSLLGPMSRVAGREERLVWTSVLGGSSVSYLRDHAVRGVPVLSTPTCLVMMSTALRQVFGEERSILELEVREPLVLAPEGVPVQLQKSGDTLELYGGASRGWVLHFVARTGAKPEGLGELDPSGLRSRLGPPQPVESFYEALTARGLDFGPSFRGLISIRSGTEALGEAELPLGVELRTDEHPVHPVLLDACFQILGSALGLEPGVLYLPVGIERFEARACSTRRLWAHARRLGASEGELLRGELTIFESSGRVVARAFGIELKRARADALSKRLSREERRELYRVAWRPADRGPGSAHRGPRAIAAELGVGLFDLRRDHALDRYDDLRPQLEALAIDYVGAAFRRLGAGAAIGAGESAEALRERFGVPVARKQPFERLLGLLRSSDADSSHGKRLDISGPELSARVDRLRREYPEFDAELSTTERCGAALSEMLLGSVDPLHVLFPEGSFVEAERLYRESPLSRVIGALLGRAVLSARGAGDRGSLRVAEIGGGTGGSTVHLVSLLDGLCDDYLFTDVSPLFVARARDAFGARRFLRFEVFDVERDVVAQGLRTGGFDFVVATNVLHATRDVRRSLQHAASLLAPGGMLLLVEATRSESWAEISFGMTEGWWRLADNDVRSSSPLLAVPSWVRLLEEVGLEEPSSVGVGGGLEQTVFLARRPATARDDGWLVLADDGGVGEGVARRLRDRGEVVSVLTRREARGELEGFGPGRIVCCWPVDAPGNEALSATRLEEAQRRLSTDLLEVTSRASKGNRDRRLWVVTRRAQASGLERVAVAASTVWGFSRALSLELPDLRTVSVDLDDDEQSLELLCDELLRPDAEDQIVYRAGRRLVGRVVRLAGPRPRDRRLEVGPAGGIDALRLTDLRRREPGPGELEIEVSAAALNFRDVLTVMGLRSDGASIGNELVGRVASLGSASCGFEVGEWVVAVAPGAFSDRVVAEERMVARVPAHLGPESAVTIPVPFITARYALVTLGRLKAGDRVLIHSAAGGVGLAALQLARHVGAEVFATAGSEAKREHLRSLGIRHVYDSRTTAFASEIMGVTSGRGVDVVLSAVVGELRDASFRALCEGGRFLELGKTGNEEAHRRATAGRRIEHFLVDWAEADREVVAAELVEVMRLAEARSIVPLPRREFLLEDAISAFRFMAQARHVGRVLLKVGPARTEPRADRTYLVTGGLGGIGLLTARWLVERGARFLALMGRSGADGEARRVISEMEGMGARVAVLARDVSVRADVVAALLEVQDTMPPLAGVVHSAGVLDDGTVLQQSWEKFARVMAPKVWGAWHLHEETRTMELESFVLYSSMASVIGSSGQSNHSAANSFLDALAFARRAEGLPATSMNWGPWSEVGAAARKRVSSRTTARGVDDISPEVGLGMLQAALEASLPQVVAAPVRWPLLVRELGSRPMFSEVTAEGGRAGATIPEPTAELWAEVSRAPEERQRAIVARHVERHAIRVLGMDSGGGLDPAQPLSELGMDSLMAVELRNALSAALGRKLPATLLYSHPAVRELTEVLLQEMRGAGGGSSNDRTEDPRPGSPEPAAADCAPSIGESSRVLDRIDELDEDEVERLLRERMSTA
ncbi:MAG: SDR family NAD(P)-dependent oxidoreductase [Deltaproteobacteria bacterium]|nr:SDR family NAD(P)-dependent oxidoreductase [Deltaproteobacteria bacterium]